MTVKVSYIADDGAVFSTESECVDYENRQKQRAEKDVRVFNEYCKFFDAEGTQFQIDKHFSEGSIYGVSIRSTPNEMIDVILNLFGSHFDSLYWALESSDYQSNNEVILVYDWIGGDGWKEIDYEQREYLKFIKGVMGWG